MRLGGKREVYDMTYDQLIQELASIGKPQTLRDLDRKRELQYAMQRLVEQR